MNNKKLSHILEMHDEATENYGLTPESEEISREEWEAFIAFHGIHVEEITEEEFEEQKKAA